MITSLTILALDLLSRITYLLMKYLLDGGGYKENRTVWQYVQSASSWKDLLEDRDEWKTARDAGDAAGNSTHTPRIATSNFPSCPLRGYIKTYQNWSLYNNLSQIDHKFLTKINAAMLTETDESSRVNGSGPPY